METSDEEINVLTKGQGMHTEILNPQKVFFLLLSSNLFNPLKTEDP